MKDYQSSLRLCLCYAMIIWFFYGSTSAQSLAETESNQTAFPRLHQLPTLKLDAENITVHTYIDFIEALRNALRDQAVDSRDWHGYTMMRREGLLLVQLSNVDNNILQTVTFLINVSNAYVLAFRVENHAHFFPNTPQTSVESAFPGVSAHRLPFGETYDDLQAAVGDQGYRDQIPLGAVSLQRAVSNLYYDSRNGQIDFNHRSRPARSLTICIQMISEAARNFIIAGRISTLIYNEEESVPDPDMIEYENSWGHISKGIQQSGQNGVFDGVQIVNRRNEPVTVSNVNDYYVRFAIALMLYVCSQPRSWQADKLPPLVIRPVVEIGDDACVNPEDPIVRIVGPSGLCAGVKDGNYKNRQAIVLQPCKSNSDESQLWTFKRNGMIQSKGKCLTAYGNQAGDYVMINDCPSQVTDVTNWQVWDNGTIISKTGLVLSANSGDEGTILRIEINTYTTSQGWRPTSYAQPLVTSLVGLDYLCLQATGNNVWLETCVKDKEDQTWVLYPDGSIRPHQDETKCLLGDTKHDGIVRIVSCYSLSAGQRWEFKSNGTVLNLSYGMVLDVAKSNPSLNQIIIYPPTGNANQKWSPVI